MLGLEQAKPGNHLGDVAHAIQRHAEAQRYSVVRDFCGHGVGRVFHDSPEVVHAGRPGTGPELRPGMIFTVEPMINIGRADVKVLDDGWTAVTRERSPSAQFAHLSCRTAAARGRSSWSIRSASPTTAARSLPRAPAASTGRLIDPTRRKRGLLTL